MVWWGEKRARDASNNLQPNFSPSFSYRTVGKVKARKIGGKGGRTDGKDRLAWTNSKLALLRLPRSLHTKTTLPVYEEEGEKSTVKRGMEDRQLEINQTLYL